MLADESDDARAPWEAVAADFQALVDLLQAAQREGNAFQGPLERAETAAQRGLQLVRGQLNGTRHSGI